MPYNNWGKGGQTTVYAYSYGKKNGQAPKTVVCPRFSSNTEEKRLKQIIYWAGVLKLIGLLMILGATYQQLTVVAQWQDIVNSWNQSATDRKLDMLWDAQKLTDPKEKAIYLNERRKGSRRKGSDTITTR